VLTCCSELRMLLQGPQPDDGLDGDGHNISFPCYSTGASSFLAVPSSRPWPSFGAREPVAATVTGSTSSDLDAKPKAVVAWCGAVGDDGHGASSRQHRRASRSHGVEPQAASTKCIEERGEAFLHLLSPQMQIAYRFCLFYWMRKSACTVICDRHICVCMYLLESVLPTHGIQHPFPPLPIKAPMVSATSLPFPRTVVEGKDSFICRL
jgi:hypothetical protein